jgi:hypothetical protein
MSKKRKLQKNLTPVGTVLNNMELIRYSEVVQLESERRREFILKCLLCGCEFKLVNRYFLRSESTRCPKCKKGK